ncbi:nicotinamide-nucleotide amidohydrolase family protein [Sphingopyxis sp. PAMC25046]|uniref:CinA family protein n=1 Tax=Sphingopyxis sp. PAMC25046 TaxID=2565556 RepID=UPI001445FC70|nr:nicotinamide-nucleotide amidohydrolase family protein [Sphingopyxis sp. PAMC25046]
MTTMPSEQMAPPREKRRRADATRRLANMLAEAELRVATAESCTGGQLAALFAGDAALGPWLERGFIVYSADAKCEMLGLDRADAERDEGVNAEATRAMAAQALARSRAGIAVAVTGFCGPQQGNEEVGLLFIAAAHHETRVEEHHVGDIGRAAVLEAAVDLALAMLEEAAAMVAAR